MKLWEESIIFTAQLSINLLMKIKEVGPQIKVLLQQFITPIFECNNEFFVCDTEYKIKIVSDQDLSNIHSNNMKDRVFFVNEAYFDILINETNSNTLELVLFITDFYLQDNYPLDIEFESKKPLGSCNMSIVNSMELFTKKLFGEDTQLQRYNIEHYYSTHMNYNDAICLLNNEQITFNDLFRKIKEVQIINSGLLISTNIGYFEAIETQKNIIQQKVKPVYNEIENEKFILLNLHNRIQKRFFHRLNIDINK